MLKPELIQNAPPLPLLITGVTGVAGYQAFGYFQQKYPGQVIAIRQESNWPLKSEGIVPCDAEDPAALRALFEKYQFRSVLNCAGNCALKSCELDPEMAFRTNLTGLRNLLDVLDSRPEVRLVHLSVDLVFSGSGEGGHSEKDWTDPLTMYGKSMAAAEHLVMLARPDALTLRISLPMGISYSGHAGAIDWIQWRFKNNKPATLYYDEIRTPTYTDCLNQVLHYSLNQEVRGLFHAGGPRWLSLYQIGQIVNRIGGYDPELLIGCTRKEAGPMPPRAGNVAMNSSRLEQLVGRAPFDPWPFHDEYAPNNREWHLIRDQEQGSPELLASVLYRNPNLVKVET